MTKHGNPAGALMPRPAPGTDCPAEACALTQEEAATLGDGLHELFCAQARALTMGQSSSLPQETAAELMASIREHCSRHIAKYAMPYEIEVRDSLPKTLVGKVAYTVLEKEELAKQSA